MIQLSTIYLVHTIFISNRSVLVIRLNDELQIKDMYLDNQQVHILDKESIHSIIPMSNVLQVIQKELPHPTVQKKAR